MFEKILELLKFSSFKGDYRDMIGKPIPYRDLGYVSLEEFLDQSPDVCRVQYTPNGISLHGVATAADAHVASLVSRQSSKKKAKPLKPPARRPNNMRPWQPPAPSQPIHRVNRFNGGNRPTQNPNSGHRPGGNLVEIIFNPKSNRNDVFR